MHNLRDIKNQVIEEGFPELRMIRIDTKWDPVDDGVMKMGPSPTGNKMSRPTRYIIYVDPYMRSSTEKSIRAGIAHEGVHILKYMNLTKEGILKEERRYNGSRAYWMREEICTDLGVINRGFGYDLIELERFIEKDYNSFGIPRSHIEEILSRLTDLPVPFTYQEYKAFFL